MNNRNFSAKGLDFMKKAAAVLIGFAALSVGVCAIPDAAVNAMPVLSVISPKTVSYSKTLQSRGTLAYLGQSDVTSVLPLVIKEYRVAEGDIIEAGDVVALVDRQGSLSLLESLGKYGSVAVSTSDLSAAAGLIPAEITSDRSGRVLSTAGSGAAVQAGNSICTVAGTDTLVITAPVSELYISEIEVGQNVTFTLSAYPNETFVGAVSAIAGSARSQYSGSVLETVVDVTITPNEFDERMKAGLTADVSFTLTPPQNICVLSYDAIGQDDGGEYVYVYNDGKAVKRRISTGAEFTDGAQVIIGVTEHEQVISSPEKISENSYIRME